MTASTLATAALAFAGTTIDDLVILAVLFTARRTGGIPAARVIIAGQYAGFAVILAIALAAAVGLQIVPDRWAGLLGLVPIGFGLCELWRLRGTGQASRPPLASTATRIAAITLANGADNISVFTPLFRTLHVAGSLLATAMFLALLAVWCATGALLASHTAVAATLGRITRWLVPTVFIAVGVLILITSGTLTTIRQTTADSRPTSWACTNCARVALTSASPPCINRMPSSQCSSTRCATTRQPSQTTSPA